MKEETAKPVNSVLLEGPVCSCSVHHVFEDTSPAVLAKLEICTAARRKDKNGVHFENVILHRAIVLADGENAEKIRSLSQKTIDLTGDISKLDYVRLEGSLAANKSGQHYVNVPKEGISFLTRMSFKNDIRLQGKVLETTNNSAYAGAILECEGPDKKSVIVPIQIYSKDNPRKYSDLCSGKVRKGDVLSVKGPLISRIYSNGENNVFQCNVNVNSYENLNKKKSQKKQTNMGM